MISFTRIALFVLVAVTIAFPVKPQAAIYKWQDAEGNLHFTDDLTNVPPDYRDRVNLQDLPEETVNVTPAPPPSAPPSTAPPAAEPDPSQRYAECVKRAEEKRKQLNEQLTQDRERLVELNRLIHRSTTSRTKNEYQRERVAVQDRIAETEGVLRDELPPLVQECESIRYWQGEE